MEVGEGSSVFGKDAISILIAIASHLISSSQKLEFRTRIFASSVVIDEGNTNDPVLFDALSICMPVIFLTLFRSD